MNERAQNLTNRLLAEGNRKDPLSEIWAVRSFGLIHAVLSRPNAMSVEDIEEALTCLLTMAPDEVIIAAAAAAAHMAANKN